MYGPKKVFFTSEKLSDDHDFLYHEKITHELRTEFKGVVGYTLSAYILKVFFIYFTPKRVKALIKGDMLHRDMHPHFLDIYHTFLNMTKEEMYEIVSAKNLFNNFINI